MIRGGNCANVTIRARSTAGDRRVVLPEWSGTAPSMLWRRAGTSCEDALTLVDQKLEAMTSELKAWEALSRSTSFAAQSSRKRGLDRGGCMEPCGIEDRDRTVVLPDQ